MIELLLVLTYVTLGLTAGACACVAIIKISTENGSAMGYDVSPDN